MKKRRPTKEQFQKQLEEMVASIRKAIIEGQYQPGQYLPPEKQLEKQFDLSNNSVRIALEQLVQEGWIHKIPRVGNQIAEGRPPVTLRMDCNLVDFRNLQLEGLLAQFQKMYPWISVDARSRTSNSNIFNASHRHSSTTDADVILLDNYQLQIINELNGCEILDVVSVDPNVHPQLSRILSVNDVPYLRPLIFSPIVLGYNREHFRERGLIEPNGNWTWDDLIAHAENLSDGKGRYGFGFHMISTNRWPLFLLQSRESFQWDEQGRLIDIRGTRLMESMKLGKTLIHNRKAFPAYLSENNDDIDQMFLEGKISMILTSYMALNTWRQADIEYDISPVPFMDELRTLVIVLGAGINRESSHKNEAQLLVDFLSSTQAQEYIREHTFSIPCNGTLPLEHSNPQTDRPSRYMMYLEVMASLRPIKDLNLSSKDLAQLFRLLKAYWARMIDEDELCDRLIEQLSFS